MNCLGTVPVVYELFLTYSCEANQQFFNAKLGELVVLLDSKRRDLLAQLTQDLEKQWDAAGMGEVAPTKNVLGLLKQVLSSAATSLWAPDRTAARQ